MARPERMRKTSSFWGTERRVCCFPLTSTISHAITSTTPVRMAVPRLDSTPLMPILPRIDVRDAKTAESTAYMSQLFFSRFSPETDFFSIIKKVPAPIKRMAKPLSQETGSPRKISASRMVRIVLDLSMGTTLFTSPCCRARK